jgi:hypothetical protein
MSSAPGVVMYLMSHTIIDMKKKSSSIRRGKKNILKEHDERVIRQAMPFRSGSTQVPKTKENFHRRLMAEKIFFAFLRWNFNISPFFVHFAF